MGGIKPVLKRPSTTCRVSLQVCLIAIRLLGSRAQAIEGC